MIFYKELRNIKQTLINNGFPKYIADDQIKRAIKNSSQIMHIYWVECCRVYFKHCNTPSIKHAFIKLFLLQPGALQL